MTLFSWGNPRYFPRLPAPVRRCFDVALDARMAKEVWTQIDLGARVAAAADRTGSPEQHAPSRYARGLS